MKPRSSTQHTCLAACLPAFTGRSYLLLFLCSVATSGGGGGGACVLFRATALVRHLFICDPQMPLVVVLVVDGLLLLSAIHAIRSFVRFAGMYLCTYVGSVSIIPCCTCTKQSLIVYSTLGKHKRNFMSTLICMEEYLTWDNRNLHLLMNVVSVFFLGLPGHLPTTYRWNYLPECPDRYYNKYTKPRIYYYINPLLSIILDFYVISQSYFE